MSRSPRAFEAGWPLHILQRGNDRKPCFQAAEDYSSYLHWLDLYARKYGCAIHAYVLMTNHVHLALTPSDQTGPSSMMQSLGRRYVSLYNRKYRRTGTLWEGRFKSHLVDTDAYLLTLYRYIEMNPVRARMVDDPAAYRWSSYHHNALGKGNERIRPHELFTALGRDNASRCEAYRGLVSEALEVDVVEAIRACINSGQALSREARRRPGDDSDPTLTRL
jgi:putative transposase